MEVADDFATSAPLPSPPLEGEGASRFNPSELSAFFLTGRSTASGAFCHGLVSSTWRVSSGKRFPTPSRPPSSNAPAVSSHRIPLASAKGQELPPNSKRISRCNWPPDLICALMYTSVLWQSDSQPSARAIPTPRRIAEPLRASPDCWSFCLNRVGQQVSLAILAASTMSMTSSAASSRLSPLLSRQKRHDSS